MEEARLIVEPEITTTIEHDDFVGTAAERIIGALRKLNRTDVEIPPGHWDGQVLYELERGDMLDAYDETVDNVAGALGALLEAAGIVPPRAAPIPGMPSLAPLHAAAALLCAASMPHDEAALWVVESLTGP